MPEIEEWINEKSREELEELVQKAESVIKERESGTFAKDPFFSSLIAYSLLGTSNAWIRTGHSVRSM